MNVSDTRSFVLPLYGGDSGDDAFLGCSFFVNRQGWLATCSHNLQGGNSFCGRLMSTGEIYNLEEVRHHPKADFAVARVPTSSNGCLGRFQDRTRLGQELWATGYFKEAHTLALQQRTLRGYITRLLDDKPTWLRTGASALELSFPSVSGFSGAPVISHDMIIGMLFNNTESEVTVYKHEEVESDGRIQRERVARVQEFGLAHSISDLVVWAEELGVRFNT